MKAKPRYEVRRVKDRARYDRQGAYAILDAGFLAHVGFCVQAQPFVIPMLYVRDGDRLLLHGSIASRLLKSVGDGIETCVSATLVDGLVLARSQFHHSVNYRSVVAFGKAQPIVDAGQKRRALEYFVEAMLSGRAAESRAPDRNELAATAVLAFDIADISAKVRNGGAKDDKADLDLPFWAGVIPMQTRYGKALPSPDCAANPLPASVVKLFNEQASGA